LKETREVVQLVVWTSFIEDVAAGIKNDLPHIMA
jgi:hypothetical protein